MSRYTCACNNLVQAVNDGKQGDYHAECAQCYEKDKQEEEAKKDSQRLIEGRDNADKTRTNTA